jgi:branched-chain amino acid transport system ATP-binding protein
LLSDLRGQGVTVLLIEQNLRFATSVAERHYLLAQGTIVDVLTTSEVRAREHELLAHLGV